MPTRRIRRGPPAQPESLIITHPDLFACHPERSDESRDMYFASCFVIPSVVEGPAFCAYPESPLNLSSRPERGAAERSVGTRISSRRRTIRVLRGCFLT